MGSCHAASQAGPDGTLRVGWRLAPVLARKHAVGAGQRVLAEPLVLQGCRCGDARIWVKSQHAQQQLQQ